MNGDPVQLDDFYLKVNQLSKYTYVQSYKSTQYRVLKRSD